MWFNFLNFSLSFTPFALSPGSTRPARRAVSWVSPCPVWPCWLTAKPCLRPATTLKVGEATEHQRLTTLRGCLSYLQQLSLSNQYLLPKISKIWKCRLILPPKVKISCDVFPSKMASFSLPWWRGIKRRIYIISVNLLSLFWCTKRGTIEWKMEHFPPSWSPLSLHWWPTENVFHCW